MQRSDTEFIGCLEFEPSLSLKKRVRQSFNDKGDARVAHRQTWTISPFLLFYHGTLDVGNNVVGVGNDVSGTRNIVVNVGNDIVGVGDVVTNVGNRYVRIDGKFGLGTGWSALALKSNRTHIKDVKDPVEVQPPGRNHVFVAFCEEKTRN
jgi:hypothetical protein